MVKPGRPSTAEHSGSAQLTKVRKSTQGRAEETAAVLEPALREAWAVGSTREDAMLTGAWGRVLVARGRLDEAEIVMAEAVRLAEQIGDGLQYLFCQRGTPVCCASGASGTGLAPPPR